MRLPFMGVKPRHGVASVLLELGTMTCVATLGSALAFPAEAQTYNLTLLPAPNGWNSIALGVNNAGQVVGYSFSSGATSEQALIWNGATPTVLQSPLGNAYSIAQAINNSGQVVGYSQGAGGTSAVTWNGTTPTVLDSLGGIFSQAVAIDDAATIAGVSNGTAVIWNGTTPTVLNSPNGPTSAAGINNAGQVVGEYNSGSAVVVWNTHTPSAAPTVLNGRLGTTYVSVAGINDAGEVAGNLNGGENAVIWNGTTPTVLGRPYGNNSSATGINDAGQVVGFGCCGISGGNQVAIIWNGTTATDLNTLVDPSDLGLFKLEVAFAISSNGNIVGYGEDEFGKTEAFLLTPSVPEPSTWAMMLLGLAGIGFMAYRQRSKPGRISTIIRFELKPPLGGFFFCMSLYVRCRSLAHC